MALVQNTAHHQARIAQRIPVAFQRADAKLAALKGVDRSSEARMLFRAKEAGTVSQRIHWLRRAADAGTQEVAKLAACRDGCSHCCHQAVVLSKAEAQIIAKAIGATLNPAAGRLGMFTENLNAAKLEMQRRYAGQACVFLRAGRCSIYLQRPLVCRLLVNLDDDDLLCQIVDEGESPVVPYLNMGHQEIRAAILLGSHQSYDDIREWFTDMG